MFEDSLCIVRKIRPILPKLCRVVTTILRLGFRSDPCPCVEALPLDGPFHFPKHLQMSVFHSDTSTFCEVTIFLPAVMCVVLLHILGTGTVCLRDCASPRTRSPTKIQAPSGPHYLQGSDRGSVLYSFGL